MTPASRITGIGISCMCIVLECYLHMHARMWIMTPLIHTHLLYRHLTQGTEHAVLQAPRPTPGVERMGAGQPAGAGWVWWSSFWGDVLVRV